MGGASVFRRRVASAEPGGARRLRNAPFFSAPQLQRDPLSGTLVPDADLPPAMLECE